MSYNIEEVTGFQYGVSCCELCGVVIMQGYPTPFCSKKCSGPYLSEPNPGSPCYDEQIENVYGSCESPIMSYHARLRRARDYSPPPRNHVDHEWDTNHPAGELEYVECSSQTDLDADSFSGDDNPITANADQDSSELNDSVIEIEMEPKVIEVITIDDTDDEDNEPAIQQDDRKFFCFILYIILN